MKIKASILKEEIKKMVREVLAENSMLNEAGLTSEKKTTPRRKALAKRFKQGLEEAGYKIVSKVAFDVQKDDQARRVQTEPDVNETAYKTQGPGQKTCKDSPQLPSAVNNPKNP